MTNEVTPASLSDIWTKCGEDKLNFHYETGISPDVHTLLREDWDLWNPEWRERYADKHRNLTDAFFAYMYDFHFPPSAKLLEYRRLALFFVLEGDRETAQKIFDVIRVELRLGHESLRWCLIDPEPYGQGNPREFKPWPPEEDCQSCPSGRKGDPKGHKFGCAVYGGYAMTLNVNLRES